MAVETPPPPRSNLSTEGPPGRSPLGILLLTLLWLAAAPIILGSLLALAGPFHWAPLLLTHFRPQLAVAALLLVLLALALRRRRTALALAIALVASAWPIASAMQAHAPEAEAPANITVAVANIYYGNEQTDALTRTLLDLDADLLMLTEVLPRRHAEVIARLQAAYPYRAFPAAEGSQGEALFSRFPLSDQQRRSATESASLWVVEAALPSGPTTLLIGHPLPATSGKLDAVHAAWFAAAEQELKALPAGAAVLVLGDLNATPWSSRLANLLALGDLRWTGDYLGTWPSYRSRWSSLPIDHILVPAGTTVEDWHTVVQPGSDHRAVVARLALPLQP